MNEKYVYTGPNNKKCPICKKRFETGPPVMILSLGDKLQHRWCVSCFNATQTAWLAAGSERRIEQEFLPHLTSIVKDFIPDDYRVVGCWFATVPKQGLTLVMEVRDAYS
jgi:hypothetical protein